MDMSDGTDLGERYYEIEEMRPNAVVTFDLAGHSLRTGNDTLSLNNLYARFAHILFQRADRFGSDLKCRQNLSMFTYFSNSDDIESCREHFSEIPNIREFVSIIYKPDNEKDRDDNRMKIRAWWDKFKKEAML